MYTSIKYFIADKLSQIYEDEREVSALTKMILTEIFNLSVTDYYLGKDIKLSEKEYDLLCDILSRMQKGEPIQYILRSGRFLGRDYEVGEGILIPRQETEELVELVMRSSPTSAKILDIGTGSGCIAISLSLGVKDSDVDAWDISPIAVEIAKRNNAALGGKVNFNRVDILEYMPSGEENYDVIVSNPPYICEEEKVDMDRNVLEWEPSTALFVPNEDPLLFYRTIAEKGRSMLVSGGRLFFEINRRFGGETRIMLVNLGYKDVEIIKDISGNDRIVTAKR